MSCVEATVLTALLVIWGLLMLHNHAPNLSLSLHRYFFDVAASAAQQKGVQVVVQWADERSIPGTAASQFAASFFSGLCTVSVTLAEAYALAGHAVQAHCTIHQGGLPHVPPLPVLYAPGMKPLLPHASTIPTPDLPEGVQLEGLEPKVEGEYRVQSSHVHPAVCQAASRCG